MDLSYYVFATYVFVLVCACLWLFGRVAGRKKGGRDAAGYEKEQKLFALYQNVEDMLAGFEEYVQETQAEADRNVGEMRRMLEEAKSLTAQLKAMGAAAQNPQPVGAPEIRPEPEALHIVAPPVAGEGEPIRIAPALRISRTGSRVLELKNNGFDQSEIARKLGISVREVSLAMKIAGAGEGK